MSGSASRRLWLLTSDGARHPVPNSEALAELLSELSRDRALRQALTSRGAGAQSLVPTGSTTDEPEWLRAEEMLEEAAACPGERLFARTLTSAAHRHSAGEIAIAAQALAAAVGQGAIPAPHPDRVLAGCLALAAAASQLPPSLQIEVAESGH